MDPIDEVMTDAGSQQPVFADASVEATIASLPPLEQPSLTTNVYSYPTAGSFSNKALQRSIALALKQIGFDSATPQALDSFAQHAESCMFLICVIVVALIRTHPLTLVCPKQTSRTSSKMSTILPSVPAAKFPHQMISNLLYNAATYASTT